MTRGMVVSCLVVIAGAVGYAGQLALKDLPPAVRATVERETKNAVIKGLSKENEKGKVVYELESVVDGRTRDLMIDEAGRVYLTEEELDPTKLPPAVRDAFQTKGTIVKAESVIANGETTYEGQMKAKTGKTVTMEVDAEGRPIKK